jgi:hypothetical protein
VIGALALAQDGPQLVIGHELPWQGRIDSNPNWSKEKPRSTKLSVMCSIRSSLELQSQYIRWAAGRRYRSASILG